jgi:hypothetical protein
MPFSDQFHIQLRGVVRAEVGGEWRDLQPGTFQLVSVNAAGAGESSRPYRLWYEGYKFETLDGDVVFGRIDDIQAFSFRDTT